MKTSSTFKAILTGFGISTLMLLTACSTFYAEDDTVSYDINNPSVVTEHEVSVWSSSVLTKKGLDGLSVDYGNVKIGVNKYTQAGDVEMMNAIGNAIVNGIIAYGTSGSVPVVKGVVMSTLMGTQQNASTNAPAAK